MTLTRDEIIANVTRNREWMESIQTVRPWCAVNGTHVLHPDGLCHSCWRWFDEDCREIDGPRLEPSSMNREGEYS